MYIDELFEIFEVINENGTITSIETSLVLFVHDQRIMYQSIPSLTIPPGNFFDGRIPHPPDKKEFKTPTSRDYKNELKPHPRGHYPQLFTIKT